jgi:hypothetical protein
VGARTAPLRYVFQALFHQLADQHLRTEVTFDQGTSQLFQLSDFGALVDLPER